LQILLKRLVDLAFSIPAIVLLLPLFLLIFIAIKAEDRGPVFFSQERVGSNRRRFKILKFRTMVEGAEKKGAGIFVENGDPRITRVGRFLRHTSLDELPQLINILRGEMSLIGPRPTLAYQVDNYDQRQMQRLLVKPGVTGWAQVNGRSSLSWPERIELDLWYIDNWSLWLDFLILLKTFRVVLQKSNLYKPPGYDPISSVKEEAAVDENDES
jgi:undecaprenyl phosphate N,N'-diacetylbacillosamine 1-phosphate transferase